MANFHPSEHTCPSSRSRSSLGVRVIDALLKIETPHGPAWRRYNGDGYGEHEDGAPFHGTGVGRPWLLMTGERARYQREPQNLKDAFRLSHSRRRLRERRPLAEKAHAGKRCDFEWA